MSPENEEIERVIKPRTREAMQLQHVYLKVGERYPWRSVFTDQERVFHVAGRDDGTGLDVWWWEVVEVDRETGEVLRYLDA